MKKTLSFNDVRFIFFLFSLIWLIQIINAFFNYDLNQFALMPRNSFGLTGIVTMPLLHWSYPHLIGNSLPLLVLGSISGLIAKGRNVTYLIVLFSGLLTWLFARDGIHAGASALIMGYFGFIIGMAVVHKKWIYIFVAIVTLLIYGSIIFTLLDFRDGISFEGHFFGLFAGLFTVGFSKSRKIKNYIY